MGVKIKCTFLGVPIIRIIVPGVYIGVPCFLEIAISLKHTPKAETGFRSIGQHTGIHIDCQGLQGHQQVTADNSSIIPQQHNIKPTNEVSL